MTSCLEYYYQEAKDLPEHVEDYVLSRGVTRDQVSLYGIKFFTERPTIKKGKGDWSWFNKWSRDGVRVVGFMVFPLRNSQNELVGLLFQNLERKKDKFISNLGGNEGIFFGLPQALNSIWEIEEVFITEGVFDLLPLLRLYPNSLPILTANVSAAQISFFKRYTKRVFSFLDNDEAGKDGFVKCREKTKGAFEMIQITFPAKDLNDLWVKYGEEKFQDILKKQVDRLILI